MTASSIILVGVVDGTTIQLYVDGVAMPSMALTTQSLALVSNASCYLGRSNYTGATDAYFAGSINETRIYNSALNALTVILNYQLGPDKIQVFALTDISPANNAINVPIPAPLSWTPDPAISSPTYRVYVRTDPNLLDPNSVPVPAGTINYSGTNTSANISGLANLTVYYWRADTIDAGATRYAGPRYKFTTVPPFTVITTQPQDTLVAAGTPATFTIAASNAVSYAWYKVGPPDQQLVNAGKYSGVDTATLTISDVQIAEEGKYYCIVTGLPGTTPLTVQSNSVYLWTKRLVGWWKMDGNKTDSVATIYPGAITHDGTWVPGTGAGVETYLPGILNQGMSFNNTVGTHMDIDPANQAFFNFYTKGITVSIWVKTTTNAWKLPISKLNAPTNGWFFGMNTGTNYTATWTFEGRGALNSSNTVNLRDGNWHMITGTYDPVALRRIVYVDGTNPMSAALDLSTYGTNNTIAVMIGGRTTTETSMTGMVDEARIYTYPLTAIEVAQLYTNTVPNSTVCANRSELLSDLNADCEITLEDFVIMAGQWLKCNIVPDCIP
jgi:hypothetical protein